MKSWEVSWLSDYFFIRTIVAPLTSVVTNEI